MHFTICRSEDGTISSLLVPPPSLRPSMPSCLAQKNYFLTPCPLTPCLSASVPPSLLPASLHHPRITRRIPKLLKILPRPYHLLLPRNLHNLRLILPRMAIPNHNIPILQNLQRRHPRQL